MLLANADNVFKLRNIFLTWGLSLSQRSMDKGRDGDHIEGASSENDIEIMPDSYHQQRLFRRRLTPGNGGLGRRSDRPFGVLSLLIALLLGCLTTIVNAQTGSDPGEEPDPYGYDVAVIIDNRKALGTASTREAAKEDVKAITDMLDRHLFADHIIQLERPKLATICDLFGGCPEEAGQPWPSLISQVTHPKKSRLYVYYLGPARLEGLERQLLFENGTRPYTVGWLHKQLEKTGSKSGLVLMETSFASRPLPCISEHPALIGQTMATISRNYKKLFEGRSLPPHLAELSATVPAQAPHCDRYELAEDEVKRPLFTKFVLKGIVEGEADQEPFGDRDGTIKLGELTKYLQDRIGRAVQFQWGREQHVWLAGSETRPIAKVEPREATFKEKKEPEEPSAQPEQPTKSELPKVEKKPETTRPDGDNKPTPTKKVHICDVNQQAEGCRKFCAENSGDFRCPFIGVTLSANRPVDADSPCAHNDARADCAANDQSWCHRAGETVGPGASGLIEAVGANPAGVCAWATQDESDLEDSILWQVFAPIGWRLIRPFVRPSLGCLLACGKPDSQLSASIDGIEGAPAAPIETSRSRPEEPPDSAEAMSAPIVPPLRTDFEREICDDTLPPYIGLPRWMPGTLLISEALRLDAECRPERLLSFGMPPPVTLVNAPDVPKPTYVPPPPFAMPPPIVLPPIQETVAAQPEFDPTVSQIRWLQSALMIGNYNPGPIDGAIGNRTKAAIRSWRHNQSSDKKGLDDPDGELTEDEFRSIVTEYGELFDQVHPGAPLY